MNRSNVREHILEALKELNQQLPPEEQFPVWPDTQLAGPEGLLDSLGLVNLIVLVEERISSESGVEITLSDDRTLLQQDSLFQNVETLTDYVMNLIEANEQPGKKESGL